MPVTQTRRRFLTAVSAAGAASLVPAPRALAAEGNLETASVRFVKNPAICVAPQYYSQELLRGEGFTEISYVEAATADEVVEIIASNRADFSLAFGINHIQWIDAGAPIVVLAGVHVGCYELFARDGIRIITELKGKSVGLQRASPALLTLMAAHVGLDPANDIRWVTGPSVKPLDLFAEGKTDAFLGFPPEPQELRARRVGHVILSRQSRNQTGGRRQNSSSAVRAILDDPPIHIRPVCSRKRGCEGQEPCGFNAFQHAHVCTPPPPGPQDSSHVLSRVSS
jgi:NitT/TauT family transport system substrate-binding protein